MCTVEWNAATLPLLMQSTNRQFHFEFFFHYQKAKIAFSYVKIDTERKRYTAITFWQMVNFQSDGTLVWDVRQSTHSREIGSTIENCCCVVKREHKRENNFVSSETTHEPPSCNTPCKHSCTLFCTLHKQPTCTRQKARVLVILLLLFLCQVSWFIFST